MAATQDVQQTVQAAAPEVCVKVYTPSGAIRRFRLPAHPALWTALSGALGDEFALGLFYIDDEVPHVCL